MWGVGGFSFIVSIDCFKFAFVVGFMIEGGGGVEVISTWVQTDDRPSGYGRTVFFFGVFILILAFCSLNLYNNFYFNLICPCRLLSAGSHFALCYFLLGPIWFLQVTPIVSQGSFSL